MHSFSVSDARKCSHRNFSEQLSSSLCIFLVEQRNQLQETIVVASDAELLEQMRMNNQQAFAELYERHKTGIYRYCLKMVTDHAAAEDATHETFLKMFTHAGTLQDPNALHAWLLSIARNEVLSFFRRQKRNGTRTDDEVWTDQTPHDMTVSIETTEIVQTLMCQLKTEYREVLVLRQYEQLSYAEIASITGDTESSVKSRLFKARKALMEKLKLYYS
jgi:RNA polymerase sigma-70 factor, ECF subfamily